MDVETIVGLILIFFVVVVPVLGFTARFALKPLGESLLHLREAFLQLEPASRGEARLRELEEEVRELRRSLDRLTASRDWEQALLERGGPSPRSEAGTPGSQPRPTGGVREVRPSTGRPSED